MKNFHKLLSGYGFFFQQILGQLMEHILMGLQYFRRFLMCLSDRFRNHAINPGRCFRRTGQGSIPSQILILYSFQRHHIKFFQRSIPQPPGPQSALRSCYTIQGAFSFACLKRSLAFAALMPTNISANSEPEIKKNGTCSEIHCRAPQSPGTA